MSVSPSRLVLLGVAEELSTAEAHLGDPATEARLRHLLDRVVDAVVDVTQGREAPSRSVSAPDAPTSGQPSAPADLVTADAAACSALAARCHRAAARLDELSAQPLAAQVALCLRQLAGGLQDLVQDLPREQPPVMRQRFLRSLRRATAHLDGGAP